MASILSVGQYDDAVGAANGRESMGNQQGRLAAREFGKALEDFVFGPRVERRGRLVEDQHVGVAHRGAGDRDLLPLAAGQFEAGLEAPSDQLVVALGSRAMTSEASVLSAAAAMRARSSRASMRPTAMLSAADR